MYLKLLRFYPKIGQWYKTGFPNFTRYTYLQSIGEQFGFAGLKGHIIELQTSTAGHKFSQIHIYSGLRPEWLKGTKIKNKDLIKKLENILGGVFYTI